MAPIPFLWVSGRTQLVAGPCGDHMRLSGVTEEPGLGTLAPCSDQGRPCAARRARAGLPCVFSGVNTAVLLASAGVTMAPCFQPLSLRFWVVLKLKGLSAVRQYSSWQSEKIKRVPVSCWPQPRPHPTHRWLSPAQPQLGLCDPRWSTGFGDRANPTGAI